MQQQQLLLLRSRFSHVRLCAIPQAAAHQASPSLGFSRQEHWSGLPFPYCARVLEKVASTLSGCRESHGGRSLVGYSPWGRKESDTTERLHFSLSCTGDGNGNPLPCSSLENPRNRGAWWAAVYGVAQSRTRLK